MCLNGYVIYTQSPKLKTEYPNETQYQKPNLMNFSCGSNMVGST